VLVHCLPLEGKVARSAEAKRNARRALDEVVNIYMPTSSVFCEDSFSSRSRSDAVPRGDKEKPLSLSEN